jgi:thiamine biosynthesis protein ThiS
MRLTINNELAEFPEEMTVRELLERLGLGKRHVAVERNRDIVPFRTFADVQLADGDILELVTLVGGG